MTIDLLHDDPAPSSSGSEIAETFSVHGGPTTLRGAWKEFFRHPSPWILASVFIPAAAARVAMANWGVLDVIVAASVVAFWPMLEWLLHVFVLHARPVRLGDFVFDSVTAEKHRSHHRDPWRLKGGFIPLHTYVFTIPASAALWYFVPPTLEVGLTGFAVFFGLGLHYEWVHFLVHTRYKPRSRIYQRMWRNHRLHHCKNERFWMGVTTVLGDLVMQSAPPVREVPTSSSCRTLGIDPPTVKVVHLP